MESKLLSGLGRRVVALGVATALLWLIGVVGARSAWAGVPVLGYQSEESATSLIARDAAGLGSVGVDGLNLTGPPGAVSGPTDTQRKQLSAAHAVGLPAVLLVG